MLTGPAVRVGAWSVSALSLAAGTGEVAWLTASIEIPLWAVLLLTFVPTSDLIEITRSQMNRLENQEDNENNER